MKIPLFLVALLFAPTLLAQSSFPGLKSVLTEAEWKRARLDRLTPDEIGVIDAALIRHYRKSLEAVTPAIAEQVETTKRVVARFGLDKIEGDWRDQPPLVAHVVGWQSPSRFLLDNGQIWEGQEKIPYDLPNKEVTIAARPNDSYALTLNDRSTPVRVRRVK
jgi:hypothetical protein